MFQLGTVRQRSKVCTDGGRKPVWNERIPLGLVSTAGEQKMLVECYAKATLGKGERRCAGAVTSTEGVCAVPCQGRPIL